MKCTKCDAEYSIITGPDGNSIYSGSEGLCYKCYGISEKESAQVSEMNDPDERHNVGFYTKYAKIAADTLGILTILGSAILFIVGMTDGNAAVIIAALISLVSGLVLALMLGLASEISMKLTAED